MRWRQDVAPVRGVPGGIAGHQDSGDGLLLQPFARVSGVDAGG